ncbi:unnamed protein product, partial [Discosporangium mesarthrocarpum]
CTSDSLFPTVEETLMESGKPYSCTCGGGEDVWTDFLCSTQPDT